MSSRVHTLLKDIRTEDGYDWDPEKMVPLIIGREEYIEDLEKRIVKSYFFYASLSKKERKQITDMMGNDCFETYMTRLCEIAVKYIVDKSSLWQRLVNTHGDPHEKRDKKDEADRKAEGDEEEPFKPLQEE